MDSFQDIYIYMQLGRIVSEGIEGAELRGGGGIKKEGSRERKKERVRERKAKLQQKHFVKERGSDFHHAPFIQLCQAVEKGKELVLFLQEAMHLHQAA